MKKALIGFALCFVAVLIFGTILQRVGYQSTSDLTDARPASSPQKAAVQASAPKTPEILDQRDLALKHGAKGLIFSAREPVNEGDITALVSSHQKGYTLIRVFTYRDGSVPQKDQPAALWEWTPAEGLKKRY